MDEQTARTPGPRDADWRDRILTDPEAVLGDRDVMRALVDANERLMGGNVVDMRGIAMERLQARLERLEDTHRSVIAAAYENLAGTNQVHRLLLGLMEAPDIAAFLDVLCGDAVAVLRVDVVRLALESASAGAAPHPGVVPVGAGFVTDHMGRRGVILRQCDGAAARLYDRRAPHLRSEACMRLDLGPGRLPGMLALASEDPHQFAATQGTELLGFLAAAVERMLRRHLDG